MQFEGMEVTEIQYSVKHWFLDFFTKEFLVKNKIKLTFLKSCITEWQIKWIHANIHICITHIFIYVKHKGSPYTYGNECITIAVKGLMIELFYSWTSLMPRFCCKETVCICPDFS